MPVQWSMVTMTFKLILIGNVLHLRPEKSVNGGMMYPVQTLDAKLDHH